MTVKIYDKLVRDNIPTILKNLGMKYKVVRAEDGQILTYLTKKLVEELQELVDEMLADPESPEGIVGELADIYAVLLKLADVYGIEEEDILEFMELKGKSNGEFNEGWILKWIDEEIEPEEFITDEELIIPTPKFKNKKQIGPDLPPSDK
jgi:predicted house-cleaning noncanonical NTP pyrophosphatase (MazG superfamily)